VLPFESTTCNVQIMTYVWDSMIGKGTDSVLHRSTLFELTASCLLGSALV